MFSAPVLVYKLTSRFFCAFFFFLLSAYLPVPCLPNCLCPCFSALLSVSFPLIAFLWISIWFPLLASSFSFYLLTIEVSVSRRRRGITRCPETPPTPLSSAPNGSSQRAKRRRNPGEGRGDPGEGGRNPGERRRHPGEGERDLEERRSGLRDYGERKGAITGEGQLSRSPLWPAGGGAGSGGGAAAVSDPTRSRIRHSHTHHTCSGNYAWMSVCVGLALHHYAEQHTHTHTQKHLHVASTLSWHCQSVHCHICT